MAHEFEPYLKYCHKKRLDKDETLYNQGEKGSGFYYLVEGKIRLQLVSEEGKERIIDYLIAGSLLGEQGIIEQPYSTSAVCDTDATLYYISVETFKKICKKHPEAEHIFINSFSNKIKMLSETVTIINKPYEEQMAHFLVQLYQKYNNPYIPITQISLAKYIGTSRITVHKIIQKWSDKRLITLEDKKIRILNLTEMKAILE